MPNNHGPSYYAPSFNGRTPDFESGNLGSNPSGAIFIERNDMPVTMNDTIQPLYQLKAECRILLSAKLAAIGARTSNPAANEPFAYSCNMCDRPYTVRKTKHTGNRYCSDDCKRHAMSAATTRWRVRHHHIAVPLPDSVDCAICSRPFVRHIGNQIYCSEPCARLAKRQRDSIAHRIRHNLDELILRTIACPVCNTTFTQNSGNQVYCTSKCKNKMGNDKRKPKRRKLSS